MLTVLHFTDKLLIIFNRETRQMGKKAQKKDKKKGGARVEEVDGALSEAQLKQQSKEAGTAQPEIAQEPHHDRAPRSSLVPQETSQCETAVPFLSALTARNPACTLSRCASIYHVLSQTTSHAKFTSCARRASDLADIITHFQTLVDDEERQLLVANVMEEIAGKEQKAAADPTCSRHIEALLCVAQPSQLTAFLTSIMDTGGMFELAAR